MPVHPYPSFSWSHSRDSTFLWCARKYYWQYYGAHNGWLPEANPEAQHAFVLKHLTALPLVLGITVHQLAREMAVAIQQRKSFPSLETLIRRTRDELNRAVLASYHRSSFIQHPTQHQMLQEIWRDGELDASLVERIRAKMHTCLRALHNSPVWDDLRACDPSSILVVDTMGTFVIDGVTIYAAPDLVYQPTPGNLVVIDWKTGSEHGVELQLPLCALLIRETLGIPFAEQSWQGRVINLYSGEETWYDLASADLEFAEHRIRTSIAAMRSYLADPGSNVPLPKAAFPLVAPPQCAHCRTCSFYELCTRELGDDSARWGMIPANSGG